MVDRGSSAPRGVASRRRRRALCAEVLLALTTIVAEPAVATSGIEVSWPIFVDAHAVVVERGLDQQTVAPVARLPGDATRYLDETSSNEPRVCYRVRAVDEGDRTIDQLELCFARSETAPNASPPPTGPQRWRGHEGWYQVLPEATGVATPAEPRVP